MLAHDMYVILLGCAALILQFLPPVVLLSSPGPLTREVGQDVVFMFNGTAMSEATWGIRDGDTNDLRPRLIKVLNPGGIFPDSQLDKTSYAGRVSFVGDLSKGQAWFKITNLNINDTNQYMAKIILQGEAMYKYSATTLTVIPPATTVATTTLQRSTSATPSPSTLQASHTPTSPTTSQAVLQLSNQSMSIKVVKEASGDLSDPNSTAYHRFSESFVSEINSVYRNIKNFEKARVTSLSENSIPVKFVVFFERTMKPDEACAPLEDAVKDNRLGSLKIIPGSLGCSNELSSSIPKNQSSTACTCTSIIAACVAVIIFLILAVLVLLIHNRKLKSNIGKGTECRIPSRTQDKKFEAYENAHQMEDTSVAMTTHKTQTPSTEKEIYETINEKRDKGASETANIKATRGPSVGIQGAGVPSSQEHYQELQRVTPGPVPLYEPLKQSQFGNKQQLTSDVPKTYEQLQQSASGREYQSLKSYKADSESKV